MSRQSARFEVRQKEIAQQSEELGGAHVEVMSARRDVDTCVKSPGGNASGMLGGCNPEFQRHNTLARRYNLIFGNLNAQHALLQQEIEVARQTQARCK